MVQELTHESVLQEEVLQGLAIKENGLYLDATFGRGGHARLILERLGEKGRLIAFDQDPEAIRVAQRDFCPDPRFQIIHGNFSELQSLLAAESIDERFDGIFMDLGVSSPQLDDAERGFSFMRSGPLDMRMNPTVGESAAQWLARAEANEIADVLWQYGEERLSRRIAKAIVMDRQQQPFTTTKQLATLLTKILPRDKHKHPATRTFQAIRIHINRELESLETVLQQIPELLKPQGRMAIISFHSLEDRMVKRFIRSCARPPAASHQHRRLPRGLLLEAVDFQATLKNVGKAIFASDEEKSGNLRSRSAVLRVAERV